LIEPVLAAWRFERRSRALDIGRPPEHELRAILDAILYVDRTGVQWRYLPHDFPPWETVYGYFAKWEKDGVFTQLSGLLRSQLREHEGHNTHPSACVIDAQSVKTSTSVPATSQGTDAAKKIVGRTRRSARSCSSSSAGAPGAGAYGGMGAWSGWTLIAVPPGGSYRHGSPAGGRLMRSCGDPSGWPGGGQSMPQSRISFRRTDRGLLRRLRGAPG
jgi:transposase